MKLQFPERRSCDGLKYQCGFPVQHESTPLVTVITLMSSMLKPVAMSLKYSLFNGADKPSDWKKKKVAGYNCRSIHLFLENAPP